MKDRHTMDAYRSISPFRSNGRRDNTKLIKDTKTQIGKQLAAVIELCDLNITFLEETDKAWIAYIIETAFSSIGEDDEAQDSGLERSSRGQSGLLESLSLKHLRQANKPSNSDAEDLKILLSVSKSLNAATQLLSCCYDRWLWLQSAKISTGQLSRMSSEAKDFLRWSRQNSRRQDSFSATDDMHHRRSSNDEYVIRPETQHQRDGSLTSIGSGSEIHISSLVTETVEKWCQDAEDALNATTLRYHNGRGVSQTREFPANGSACTHDPTVSAIIEASRPGTNYNSRARRPSGAARLLNLETLHESGSMSMSSLASSSVKIQRSHPFGSISLDFTDKCFSRQNLVPSSPRSDIASTCSTTESRKHSSSYIPNLQNSLGMESVGNETSEALPLGPMGNPDRNFVRPSMSSLSSGSSEIFSQTTNKSTSSFQSRMIDTGQIHHSRGRVWLQAQAECSD